MGELTVAGFPPGLWRRILVTPHDGAVEAALEDDVHRFGLTLRHADGFIGSVLATVERFPWSTCARAGDHLARAITGLPLTALAALDPYEHCTHLIELAIVAVAHAGGARPIRFDLHVSDEVAGRMTATLARDDALLLCWQIDGTVITAPAAWAGRDLRQLSAWRGELGQPLALHVSMLRRVVHIAGARRLPPDDVSRAIDRGPGRAGACYTYQPARVAAAYRSTHPRRDFSATPQRPPLADMAGPVA